LYAKYKALAERTPKVHFVGRLATYKYYNMDQIVAQALTVYSKIIGKKRKEAAAIEARMVKPYLPKVALTAVPTGNGNGVTRPTV
jgi:UDP-galactopyranose mutase